MAHARESEKTQGDNCGSGFLGVGVVGVREDWGWAHFIKERLEIHEETKMHRVTQGLNGKQTASGQRIRISGNQVTLGATH